jgi:hypothetical protein
VLIGGRVDEWTGGRVGSRGGSSALGRSARAAGEEKKDAHSPAGAPVASRSGRAGGNQGAGGWGLVPPAASGGGKAACLAGGQGAAWLHPWPIAAGLRLAQSWRKADLVQIRAQRWGGCGGAHHRRAPARACAREILLRAGPRPSQPPASSAFRLRGHGGARCMVTRRSAKG